MLKPVNPYAGLAFYEGDIDISLKGWVYSPISKLPPFIIPISGTDNINTWSIINIETGAMNTQNNSLIDLIETTEGNFLIYDGGNLTTPPSYPGGDFRVRVVTTAPRTFYSHRICMTRFFDTVTAPSLSITDCAISGEPGDPYELEITVVAPSWGTTLLSLDENQTGSWLSLTTGAGAYTLESSSFVTPYTNITALLRLEWFYRDVNFPAGHYIQVLYALNVDGLDPCNTESVTLQSTLTQYAPEAMYFEWWNSTDLKPLSMYYAGGLKHRLYGRFGLEAPTTIIEEEYDENGEGDQFLASATISHQYNAAFWPVPDFLVLSLKTARQHDNKTITHLGGTATTVTEFDFVDAGVDQEHNRQGALQLRVDKAFIGGCVAEYELEP